MKEKPDAWMPLYIGDWDSGTRHLDCEQDGAYFRLVRFYWKNGAPADDDAQLARIVGMSLSRWRKTRRIVAVFFVIRDGFWTHNRVESELVKWSEKRRKAIERAAAGGRAKAAKSSATSTPQAVLKGCTSASSSPSEEEAYHKASSLRGRRSSALALEERALAACPEPERPNLVVVPGDVTSRAEIAAMMADLARSLGKKKP